MYLGSAPPLLLLWLPRNIHWSPYNHYSYTRRMEEGENGAVDAKKEVLLFSLTHSSDSQVERRSNNVDCVMFDVGQSIS